MTTPDRAGVPEDVGVVEVYGATFSTFTRTIKMGLHELGIKYIPVARNPHSEDIKAKNPYGLLPVLVHRPDGLYTPKDQIVTLYESNAIRRYIDELLAPISSSSSSSGGASQPHSQSHAHAQHSQSHPHSHSHSHHSHNTRVKHLTPPLSTGSTGQTVDSEAVHLRSKTDALVSSISSTHFPAFEHGFIKPAVQMHNNGASDRDILAALGEQVEKLHSLLSILESLFSSSSSAPGGAESGSSEHKCFLLGETITWPDLFLYPILADLQVTPLGQSFTGQTPMFPNLAAWFITIQSRQSAKDTYHGTIAHQLSK
ncbi:hypothetical protein BCV70DRAFT_198828 [Testicularia cyperi]|uniref:GST N-terminal domain-containing protein n=1 Tax=Testicularia cyperi TaxID=1882483 RepID=A0A317XU04_9BASI|nr:hypothetical protein BCV70DRAFT_198828 [Testicularia cyperi]